MSHTVLEFTAPGSPDALSTRIEELAQQRHVITALVVPWQSAKGAVTMAVTSVKSDGWAIEHTNLGTIRLTDLGNQHTGIAVSAEEASHPDREKLTALLDRFAGQLRDSLGTAAGDDKGEAGSPAS